MENPDSPQNQPNDNSAANEMNGAHGTPPQQEPNKPVLDALRDAIRRGAEDARSAAEKAVPKVKSATADAAYWTAYGISFAAVFHWAFAKGMTPEPLKAGVRDGVKAAREAAQKWTDNLRQRKEQTAASPEPAGPSAEGIQPGVA